MAEQYMGKRSFMGLKTSNKNQDKVLEQMREDEGLAPGSPIVTDNTGKPEKAPLWLDKQKDKQKERATPPSYKKGGKVKKTGMAKVHKGEVVVPKKKAESIQAFMTRRNKGMKMPKNY